MRVTLPFLISVFLGACGGSVAGTPSEGQPAKTPPVSSSGSSGATGTTTGGTTATTGPQNILGAVYALEEIADGQTYERFDLNLQAMPFVTEPDGGCARATITVGSCCYFAPSPPPPTLLPGDAGGANSTPPTTGSNAGTITLTNATSSASIGTFDFNKGYAPADYGQVWTPGDSLRVDASGAGDIGPFTVSAPALTPPAVQVASPIVRGKSLTISWTPEANAESFAISIGDGSSAVVACSTPDAVGSLTIDASMFASFTSNARLDGVAERWSVRYAQTPTGRVAFKTAGWFTFDTSLN